MTTLTGKFVYEDNTAVANGILVLTLSQPAIISGTAQIVPLVKVIQLDANGNIPGSAQVYGNDALTPSGTVYTAVLYTGLLNPATGLYSTGAQLFNQSWSLTGASVDVSTLTPTTNGASYVSPVTSIGLTLPGEFAVSGSPVTSAGTFVVSKANQSANQVYAGPASGGAAAPGFRVLVDADIPGALSAPGNLKNKTLTGPSSANAVSLLSAQPATSASTGTGADKVLYTFTLPGNTLGVNKALRLVANVFHSSGTASVTYKVKLGGTVLVSFSSAANGAGSVPLIVLNNGATNVQVAFATNAIFLGGAFVAGTGGLTGSAAVDTTVNQTLTIEFNVAATDQVTGQGFLVELIQ